jgi:carbamoyl-phosphate synthase small subunit
VTYPAILLLENGRAFRGRGFGARVASHGEVVFNTSLTGYQEIVSDPSYCGQIVVMTAVEIGNVGVNAADAEAAAPVCAGLVVRERTGASSWRADDELDAHLAAHGVAGIDDLDTRAITRVLRTEGAMRGVIAPAPADDAAEQALLAEVRRQPLMDGLDLVPRVTTRASYPWADSVWRAPDDAPTPTPGARIDHVVAYDFGIKRNILRRLVASGCRVTVVPASTPAAEVLAMQPDGVFLSNGPGDPAAVTYAIEAVRELLAAEQADLRHLSRPPDPRPGARRADLQAAVRPPRRQPPGRRPRHRQGRDHLAEPRLRGRPASLPAGVRVSHENLYDGTVEGLAVDGRPVFSVQYHPEASPGPHDAHYLFARFREAMRAAR